MERVSWEDAKRFIEKLNQLEKTKGYRLPSKAEWDRPLNIHSETKAADLAIMRGILVIPTT